MAINLLKETSAASVLPACKHTLAQGLVPLREDLSESGHRRKYASYSKLLISFSFSSNTSTRNGHGRGI